MNARAGAALAAALALLPAGAGAQSPCDPSLRALPGDVGYRERGDRCEGRYAQPVAGTPLYLVSVIEAFDYDTAAAGPLLVRWTAPAAVPVHLRAQGIRRQLYYRMDADRPAGTDSYEWSTDVLTSQRIAGRDLGALASARTAVGGAERTVYLPLRIGRGDQPLPCGPVRLVLWPGARLDSLTVSLAPLTGGGARGASLRESRELGLGYYPEQAPIEVRLPELTSPGFYWVRVVAHRRDGPSPLEFYLHRPPPGACR